MKPGQNERQVRRSQAPRFSAGDREGMPDPVGGGRRRILVSGDTTAPRRQFAWRNVLRGTGLVALFILLGWVVLFSHWTDVRSVSLRGSSTVSQEQLRASVEDYFRARPLQRNIFFTDVEQMATSLRQAHPTFVKMNINRTLFLGLQVHVAEVAPALIWKTGNENWVIGTDGRILRRAKDETDIVGSVTDTAQLRVESGKKVANPSFVDFIVTSYQEAGEYGLTIKDVTIGNTTQEATLILDNALQIRVDTTRSATSELEATQKTFQTASQAKKPATQYIDVRVPGRAFYK